MLKIPLQDIIKKIEQNTDLSEADINAKIDDKLKQLSGLISKEGAAHIVANELGVKVFEQTSGKLQIKNILTGMRSVETVGKVTRKFDLNKFQTDNRSGKVSSMYIGDETGTIRITMWGEMAENINNIKENDIIKIVGGYVRENRGRKEVHMNERSKIIINPEGETIKEVKDTQSQPQAQRKPIKDLTEQDQNTEILGTIVQAFEPRFYPTCPKCNKKVNPQQENYVCKEHGQVTPEFAYVMNVVLDDGTETIRTVFFRNQAERLLEKSKEEMLKYKENPEQFNSVKTELLGTQIKLVGRTQKNQMFDRLEFISQLVFKNPDPEKEIKNLKEQDN
ncbi:hypothetical protein GF361_03890 [Candidatus Woesearchaeota archaeon]|nr:hypothetical protein [Candidatus Woesearchaeota archaeon]